MAPELPSDDGSKVSVDDETSKAPEFQAEEAVGEQQQEQKEGTPSDEAEKATSEEAATNFQDNVVGGGKEIDESVAESLAISSETEWNPEETVEGPEVTSERIAGDAGKDSSVLKEPNVVGAFVDRFGGPVVAKAQAAAQHGKDQTDEVVDSVMEMATPWVQFAVAQAQGLKKTMVETTDVAVRAACNQLVELQDSTTTHYYYAKDAFWRWKRDYKQVETAFFSTLKDGVKTAAENPKMATAVGIAAAFVLFRRPRHFLFKQTLGRFRSTEAMVASAERRVEDLRQSIKQQKQEKQKLEERYMYAVDEFLRGRSKMANAGVQLRSLSRHMNKTENKATGILESLRDLPAKETLRLRAEVASIRADAKQQRSTLDRHLNRIASYNVSV